MALELFNTLSRSVQTFTPLDSGGKKVGMYCCGPTVYDFAHIGNWRTFVFADLVRRYLEFKGLAVTHVMNITDVDDKIIKHVRENKTTLAAFTGQYENSFLDDLRALGCLEPHQKPRATEHIPQIIALIEKLLARGIAYQAADGSIYFSIDKYRGCGCQYGQLLKLNFEEMRAGERVKSDEYAKESVADFALWKARVPEDGDVSWPSPFGEGRPGWHIECSAMSSRYLGEVFDIHGGGLDLIFPHHENEIAQSECCNGQQFSRHWYHSEHLLVDGKKMSKSLGNLYTLDELVAKGFSPMALRYALLMGHPRKQLNFSLDSMHAAESALLKLKSFHLALKGFAQHEETQTPSDYFSPVITALKDDLNIPAALGELFTLTHSVKKIATTADVLAFNQVLFAFGFKMEPSHAARAIAPSHIEALAAKRWSAKQAKDFAAADALRKELAAAGWSMLDSKTDYKLEPLKKA